MVMGNLVVLVAEKGNLKNAIIGNYHTIMYMNMWFNIGILVFHWLLLNASQFLILILMFYGEWEILWVYVIPCWDLLENIILSARIQFLSTNCRIKNQNWCSPEISSLRVNLSAEWCAICNFILILLCCADE